MRRKVIVITGGVLSGLGKGIVSASIGRLLSNHKVVTVKCDGYLNVDPGTMNPTEHGEVFVLDDGGEVDLDFGHYERFINMNCKFDWNLTSGKIFQALVEKERKGDFLGKTVQVIPHVTGEIRQKLWEIYAKEKADVLIIEVGGTVGDLENLWFLEACRELQREIPREDMVFIHLGLVPVIDKQGQQKTKPIQQSIYFLRERGLFPNIIIGRSVDFLLKKTKQKIHWLCNVPEENIISDPDAESVYEMPLVFAKEGLANVLSKHLNIKIKPHLKKWNELVNNIKNPTKQITIAICGKYTELADSYISIIEALTHAGAQFKCKVHVKWLETTDLEKFKDKLEKTLPKEIKKSQDLQKSQETNPDNNPEIDYVKQKLQEKIQELLANCQGVIVPGGFGQRGTEGKIEIIRYIRENNIPFLGICYGMQLAVIEYARNVCLLEDANSSEIILTKNPVIDLLPEQKTVTQKGGSMRLGGHNVLIKRHTKAYSIFRHDLVRRRFRHRYEVNPAYIKLLEDKGLIFSGKAPKKQIMQVLELKNHPYFLAVQFHPELTSRLERPSPLFVELVRNSIKFKKKL